MPGDVDLLKDELLRVTGLEEIYFAPNVLFPVDVDPRAVVWDVVLGVESVVRLRAEYVSGRIELEEFEERVAVAVAAEDAAL